MELRVTKNGTPSLRKITPYVFEMLQDIVKHASSDHPLAEGRFYPDPTTSDELLIEDWKGLVQPELQAIFQSSRDVVQADLRRAVNRNELLSCDIPLHHVNDWLNALNQARLALAAEHQLTDAEMASDISPTQSQERAAVLIKMHCYAYLQEWLIRQTE